MAVCVSWSEGCRVKLLWDTGLWSLGFWGSHCCGVLVPHVVSHLLFWDNQYRSSQLDETICVPLPFCVPNDGQLEVQIFVFVYSSKYSSKYSGC